MALSPSTPRTGMRRRPRRSPQASARPAPWRALLLAGAAAAVLAGAAGISPALAQGAAPAAEQQVARGAQQPLARARAALERGDLRTAQIEYRNAVRADPASGFLRQGLAAVSLDLGDTDTAEKEARAAIERGYDPAGSTALLMRAYLVRGRGAALLSEFPLPTDRATPPTVVAQIGAARVAASLAAGDRAGARAELEALQRAAPNEAETHLAASGLAAVEGNRAELAAAIDRALAINPDNPDGLLRKAALQLEQNQRAEAVATLDRLVTVAPTQSQARVLRAEVLMREGNVEKAREDVEAALRVSPGSVPALFLRAVLQTRAQEWRAADETLSRLGGTLSNIPDGLLLLATVKRQLRQTEQALDAAQRYVARRPEDPRGAKLLAIMELEQRQPAAAVGTIERLVQRGAADAEAFDILARALIQTGRGREAAAAMERVVAQAPGDAGAQARLAAARLAAGDTAGTVQAAQDALRLNPAQAGVREMLIVASLARGDITTAEAELGRLPPEARSTELATVAEATLRIARLDLAGGRAGLEDALRRFPESIGARLGLARVNARAGQAEEAQRLWAEVLQRDPSNVEALGAIAVTAVGGGPRAAAARAALEAAQAAAPSAPTPAITLANVLMRSGEAERALTLLDSEGLRSGPLQRGAALNLMRSEANSVLQRWPAAEAAARTAFADEPESPVTRRQLAVAMARNGDARGAEELIQAGLRRRPGDVMLQQTLVALVQQARGLDAALAAADELARQRDALPAAATLRGDLLLSAQRPADAARAYAAAYAADPSGPLALRAASAWQAAGDAAQAASALETWLQRSPRDAAALSLLAQFDLQAGRNEAAERRLATVVEQAPTDAVALNNLAWALALRGGAENLARARTLAERSYFLLPTPESADTLGWALVRSGEPQRGLPLLREAVAARRVGNPAQGGGEAAGTTDPGMVYRLAFALNATGDRAEALRVLEPVMANAAAFPERAEAEQLLTTLRRGR